ncbi:L,D-transpeptidase family protein [Micromonospora aurantiaca (nom. illeg.)]|uniref:L,D-transpeptidase n=1 Tax=Micromonospora aurantiaca (nom. illeg.) TaxID=47850 RepID=UPI003F4A11D2
MRAFAYLPKGADGVRPEPHGDLIVAAGNADGPGDRGCLRPDGVVGAKTRAALDDGKRPDARSTDGHLAEVDLDRQLLMIVDDGEVSRIFNTSTGTFERYTHQGETYLADTPRGRWTIDWQVDGWRDGPLGRLYRPKYFQEQRIAIHGYTGVPSYPASHGCVRVTLPAVDWLWTQDVLPKKTGSGCTEYRTPSWDGLRPPMHEGPGPVTPPVVPPRTAARQVALRLP